MLCGASRMRTDARWTKARCIRASSTTRLRRTPLFARRDGLVHARDYSRRPDCICYLVDFPDSASRRLAKAYVCRDSSPDLHPPATMRIYALQIFVSLVLASVSLHGITAAEDRRSWRPPLHLSIRLPLRERGKFRLCLTLHCWSGNTRISAPRSYDLQKWADMITGRRVLQVLMTATRWQ